MKIIIVLISLLFTAALAGDCAPLQGNVSEEESLRINREPPKQSDTSIQSLFPNQASPSPGPDHVPTLEEQATELRNQNQETYTNSLPVEAPLVHYINPQSSYVSSDAINSGIVSEASGFRATISTIQHGESPLGVIGCQVDYTSGIVMQVYPPSDLNRFQIHPGDRVIGYMGHRFRNSLQMVNDVVGVPGTPCEITLLHNGQMISIEVLRTDARLLVQYDQQIGPFRNHYHNCVAQTRYW